MQADDFEKLLLPRLAAASEQGRLVPFVGSGMCRRTLADWPAFITGLEDAACLKVLPKLKEDSPRDLLVQRANSAVRILRRREPDAFATAVRAALRSRERGAPSFPTQMQSLARVAWPLVLTTNYDNCYAAAFHDRHAGEGRQLAVVGRGPEDCQRVLTSLSTAGRSLLWALQGFLHDLPRRKLPLPVSPQLEAQLVVGHEEYRRVTYGEQPFRRAFAEVFRQRSLLFLGAGLQETYLQELFGEVLEVFGPGTRPHYAIVQAGEVDAAFLLARFQIMVLEYPKGEHARVQGWLDQLADTVARPLVAPVRWSWGRVEGDGGGHWDSAPELEVVRGPLPMRPATGEALAVSAGGSAGAFFFSPGIRKVLEAWSVRATMPRLLQPPYLGRFEGHAVYAVRARDEKDVRGLAHIHDASLALFDQVGRQHRRIHMQLLATGGTAKSGVSMADWKVRRYPERFSFVQTVRAWAAWRAAQPTPPACTLVLYVVLEAVYQDLASGRIDVLELLRCRDLRFFVEIVSEHGTVERRLFQRMPQTRLGDIVRELQLSPAHWKAKVTPPPAARDRWLLLGQRTMNRPVQQLGVLPGSTVHFVRVGEPRGFTPLQSAAPRNRSASRASARSAARAR